MVVLLLALEEALGGGKKLLGGQERGASDSALPRTGVLFFAGALLSRLAHPTKSLRIRE